MKKIVLLLTVFLSLTSVKAQDFVRRSSDSTRIKYATFSEASTQGMKPEAFLTSFLQLDPQNHFIPSDTIYSPDSSYTYIKYRQQYAGYEVEGSMVTLTFHNNSIIRFNGYYVPANNLSLETSHSNDDAIFAFKQYYHNYNDSCEYFVSKLVTYYPSSNQVQLCFQIQCTDPMLYNKILYVSTNDLSIVSENEKPEAGFNATFYTQYNGVRNGYNTCLPWTPPQYILKDLNVAVEVLDLYPNVTNLEAYFSGVTNTFYNSTNLWGINTSNIYPNYILDAYWAASEYSNYMQHTHNVSKGLFQRYWNNNQYVIDDTITPILIASNTFVDNTIWKPIRYRPNNKDFPHEIHRNVIVIGSPGVTHLPKASIDETVHEFAHIFSHQTWSPFVSSYESNILDSRLAEACADIWAAIITSLFYPQEEGKIWKIGEDIVMPNSGKTCVRNLALPADATAEIQMLENGCQEETGNAYEQSGVFSHWFYLLTHGFTGVGCNGSCYNFPAIPIDSAAKLLYYCESSCFYHYMGYQEICQATLDATLNFSDPESMMTSVLGAWNVLGVKPLDYGVEQFGLSYSSMNSGTYTIDEDLVIDSPNTLTVTGTLHFGDNNKIIVRPGGKLVVDGGTLTSACSGEMWQGIEIEGDRTKRQLPQYQGKVELRNGATIENAMCGIRTCLSSDISYLTAGGIIEADQAVFRNNRRAIEINSYKYYAPSGNVSDYVSSFNRCTFTVDNNNLFSANYTSFSEHVKLWDVKNIPFRGCSFSNLTNNSSNLGRGIYADDAGVIVSTHCTRPLYVNECECPASIATVSFFSGFNTAMEVITTGNPYSVTVDQTKFSNNDVGLRVNANNYVTVTRDTFNLQSAPIASSNTGLVLDNCSGYKVEGNRFHKANKSHNLSSTGIQVISNGVANNSIYLNTFDTLDYGIRVFGINGNTDGGLQMTAGNFHRNSYGIYVATGATVSPWQGSLKRGADNLFVNTQSYSIYNAGSQLITYYHSPNYPPGNVTTSNIGVVGIAAVNPRTSTLCNHNGGGNFPFLLAGFLSGMEAYTTAVGNDDGGGDRAEMRYSLSETYYESVRALMADSVLDLNALEQWHAAAQPIADPYSLTETRFMLGYDDLFAADADDAELANYAEFHAMKVSLRGQYDNTDNQDNIDSQNSPMINWYALTPAQIAQLQTIAERNAGRASVMAKGVLCFFHGICYDDDSFVDDNVDNNDNNMETRSAKASPQDGETRLNVYPNPTDDLLFVELSGAGIQSAALFDLQGRVVTNAGVCDTPQRGTATMNLRSIPAGVYLLRVTDTEGREYHQKIVKK